MLGNSPEMVMALVAGALGEHVVVGPDLGPKMWPHHVRVTQDLQTTATNKVLKRELTWQGVDGHPDPRWVREPRGTT